MGKGVESQQLFPCSRRTDPLELFEERADPAVFFRGDDGGKQW